MRGLPGILSLFCKEFNKFSNTGARMFDSIYPRTLKLLKIALFGVKVNILPSFTQSYNGLPLPKITRSVNH